MPPRNSSKVRNGDADLLMGLEEPMRDHDPLEGDEEPTLEEEASSASCFCMWGRSTFWTALDARPGGQKLAQIDISLRFFHVVAHIGQKDIQHMLHLVNVAA